MYEFSVYELSFWNVIFVAHVRRRGKNIHPQILLSSINLANMGRQGILVFY
jgi:hypothetical protein